MISSSGLRLGPGLILTGAFMLIRIFRRIFLPVRQIFNEFKVVVVVKNLWQWQLPQGFFFFATTLAPQFLYKRGSMLKWLLVLVPSHTFDMRVVALYYSF